MREPWKARRVRIGQLPSQVYAVDSLDVVARMCRTREAWGLWIPVYLQQDDDAFGSLAFHDLKHDLEGKIS